MLEKDELVRELILLLLRSLKGKFIMKGQCGCNFNVPQKCMQAKTYTSCRYLNPDSSFGTTLNWFPSRYLNKGAKLEPVNQTEMRRHLRSTSARSDTKQQSDPG